jgi:glycogen debranching enzyme
LSPDDPAYRGAYGGDPAARDGAYHQGTAWAWLLGPFALAHHRAYGDAARALEFLAPFEEALSGYGLGTLGEIFDGDAPHEPRGCIAQAWSVAEALRAWTSLAKELDV